VPGPLDGTYVQYLAWTPAGRLVDARAREHVRVNLAPAGLATAIQSMRVGETSRFWIPAATLTPRPRGVRLEPTDQLVVFDLALISTRAPKEGGTP
jgi:hypothetical protein